MGGVDLAGLFFGFLKLALVAGAALYAGLVLMTYRAGGPHVRPQFNRDDLLHSAEEWMVWLGVKFLELAAPVAVRILDVLAEASAQVGDWFLRTRRRETP